MRRLLSLLLAAAMLVALSACGEEAPTPSSSGNRPEEPQPVATPFTLAIYGEYSIHPVLAGNRANLTLAPLLYEGLFALDPAFQAAPVLCQSYSASEDGLTWTFTLRGGITFSDGTPLTGQAVADALELARAPDSRYARRLADVTGISAEGDAVTITLSRPNGNLPALLDIPIALGNGDRPPGTGPYVLSGDREELALDAREGWWQDKELPLSHIPLHSVGQSDELIYAFDSGDVSLVDVDLMATNAMGYAGNYQTWDYATTDLLYLGFNIQSGPCRSAPARLALSRAVDRDGIAQTPYANHAVASPLPVHPDSPLFDPDAAGQLSYQPDALASQLDQLGLSGQTLTLLVNSENDSKVAAAQLIVYQLGAAGLAVELVQLPFDEYTAALTRGEFDLYLGEVVLTADFDLSHLLSSSGALNYGGWRDSTTDVLVAAMCRAGQEERGAAARALFAHLAQQCPIAPLVFKNGSVLTQWGRASGLDPVRNNVFYQFENWRFT